MAGKKTFLPGETLTASDVNDYLMDQVVPVFGSTAARDTAITSPEAGMVCYINSNDANEGLYFYDGTNWRKGPSWNAPWGHIGSVMGGGEAGVGGTDTAITGASVAFTAPGGRQLEIAGFVLCTDNDVLNFTLKLFKGGVALHTLGQTHMNGSAGELANAGRVVTDAPAAGSVTYDLRITVSAGTLTISASGITVKDIGPSGAPP